VDEAQVDIFARDVGLVIAVVYAGEVDSRPVTPCLVNVYPRVIKTPEIVYHGYVKLVGEIRFKV
jgi:hypothetical protein